MCSHSQLGPGCPLGCRFMVRQWESRHIKLSMAFPASLLSPHPQISTDWVSGEVASHGSRGRPILAAASAPKSLLPSPHLSLQPSTHSHSHPSAIARMENVSSLFLARQPLATSQSPRRAPRQPKRPMNAFMVSRLPSPPSSAPPCSPHTLRCELCRTSIPEAGFMCSTLL